MEDIGSAAKGTEKEKRPDNKVKYTVKESDDEASAAESDSGPSDDNLDDDEIMKLIPKKFGKNKYIRGV